MDKINIYYTEWKEKDDRISSHELAEMALSDYLSQKKRTLPAVRTWKRRPDPKRGKPYIEELSDVHFSISHSGEYWMCAVSDAEVGLDIQIESQVKREKLAKRFFHPQEITWLDTNGYDKFCLIWAKKESWLKYTGQGLGGGLSSFSVVDPLLAEQKILPFRENYSVVVTTPLHAACRLIDLPLSQDPESDTGSGED